MRAAFLAFSLAVLQVAPGLPPTSDQRFAQFGSYLESLRRQAGIPGLAVAIVGEDDIAWEHAFGQQDIERSISTLTNTPFELDAITQVFTASLVLRCVEEGAVSLDEPIGQFKPDSPEPNATIRQLLTHTSGTADNLTFAYRPERLDALRLLVRQCTGNSFRETLANLLQRFAMNDSVPGSDIVTIVPPAEGIPDADAVDRYTRALARLATPYAVDSTGRASLSRYSATTITPAGGLISTVRDLARFDLALRKGAILGGDTLAAAWRAPIGRNGQPLPHGMGWFVQNYNGETIVWQFGVADNASSSLIITVPARKYTLVMLANSDGLVKPFSLAGGDVTASPFARAFLGLFVK